MRKLKIYFDMDGVLADFDKAVKELSHIDENPWLTVPHFFKNLEVIGNPNEVIKLLKTLDYEVFILSKVETRDHFERAKDKLDWLQVNLPDMKPENIIIVPNHLSKLDFIKSDIEDSVLIDDYKGNLLEWLGKGGIAVKFGNKFKPNRPYLQILNDIGKLIGLLKIIEME